MEHRQDGIPQVTHSAVLLCSVLSNTRLQRRPGGQLLAQERPGHAGALDGGVAEGRGGGVSQHAASRQPTLLRG